MSFRRLSNILPSSNTLEHAIIHFRNEKEVWRIIASNIIMIPLTTEHEHLIIIRFISTTCKPNKYLIHNIKTLVVG